MLNEIIEFVVKILAYVEIIMSCVGDFKKLVGGIRFYCEQIAGVRDMIVEMYKIGLLEGENDILKK